MVLQTIPHRPVILGIGFRTRLSRPVSFHGPNGRIEAQFGIRERGDVHRDPLQEGTFEDTRAGKLLGQRPPQFPVQEFPTRAVRRDAAGSG